VKEKIWMGFLVKRDAGSGCIDDVRRWRSEVKKDVKSHDVYVQIHFWKMESLEMR
jgi:hypothetical protein